ncbi:hypothetical protein BXZ70DRAFT_1010587 [Cristinia sonorae]|uniref:F-box domain-containing protein n=1 Tax=Cristinia sonorae TaxID=1940300 RepID=A0A8K0UJ81_9AGAR|nr:hypothetical protein BXZ70DRAFT_1010587 [Cristinia sonorae]
MFANYASTVPATGHSPSSPSQILPYELLEHVFSDVCTDEDGFADSFQTLILSHVSAYWRAVTQTSPRLWSIDLHTPTAAQYFLKFTLGTIAPLRIICVHSAEDIVATWPEWLSSHIRNDGVVALAIRMDMRYARRILITIKETIPDLKWLDLYGWQEYWSCVIDIPSSPVPFLRSLTLTRRRSNEHQLYYNARISLVNLLHLLRQTPNLTSIRIDHILLDHSDDTQNPDKPFGGEIDQFLPISLHHVRRLSFSGVNRLWHFLKAVSISPTFATLEIDNVGSLNVSSELSPEARLRLREAQHTHLSITTTAIEAYSATNSGSVYRFSNIKDEHALLHSMVAFGRAFHWSSSVTNLSINSDGRMFSSSPITSKTWHEALSPGWAKLMVLPQLRHFKVSGFVVDELWRVLHPSKRVRRGAEHLYVPCPLLETIVLTDFVLVNAETGDFADGYEDYAPLDVGLLLNLISARVQGGRVLGRLILCKCLNVERYLNQLSAVVYTTSMPYSSP